MMSGYVNVKCVILCSAFSGERVFQLDTASGEEFVGVAPLGFCAKKDGTPLSRGEPAPSQSLDGVVRARIIRNGGNKARVAFPDGEDAEVSLDLLAERR